MSRLASLSSMTRSTDLVYILQNGQMSAVPGRDAEVFCFIWSKWCGSIEFVPAKEIAPALAASGMQQQLLGHLWETAANARFPYLGEAHAHRHGSLSRSEFCCLLDQMRLSGAGFSTEMLCDAMLAPLSAQGDGSLSADNPFAPIQVTQHKQYSPAVMAIELPAEDVPLNSPTSVTSPHLSTSTTHSSHLPSLGRSRSQSMFSDNVQPPPQSDRSMSLLSRASNAPEVVRIPTSPLAGLQCPPSPWANFESSMGSPTAPVSARSSVSLINGPAGFQNQMQDGNNKIGQQQQMLGSSPSQTHLPPSFPFPKMEHSLERRDSALSQASQGLEVVQADSGKLGPKRLDPYHLHSLPEIDDQSRPNTGYDPTQHNRPSFHLDPDQYGGGSGRPSFAFDPTQAHGGRPSFAIDSMRHDGIAGHKSRMNIFTRAETPTKHGADLQPGIEASQRANHDRLEIVRRLDELNQKKSNVDSSNGKSSRSSSPQPKLNSKFGTFANVGTFVNVLRSRRKNSNTRRQPAELAVVLRSVASAGHVHLVKAALDLGDYWGWDLVGEGAPHLALEAAAAGGHLAVVDHLVRHVSTFPLPHEALERAAAGGHAEVVECLLGNAGTRHGAFQYLPHGGRPSRTIDNCLVVALEKGHIPLAARLVFGHGADVHANFWVSDLNKAGDRREGAASTVSCKRSTLTTDRLDRTTSAFYALLQVTDRHAALDLLRRLRDTGRLSLERVVCRFKAHGLAAGQGERKPAFAPYAATAVSLCAALSDDEALEILLEGVPHGSGVLQSTGSAAEIGWRPAPTGFLAPRKWTTHPIESRLILRLLLEKGAEVVADCTTAAGRCVLLHEAVVHGDCDGALAMVAARPGLLDVMHGCTCTGAVGAAGDFIGGGNNANGSSTYSALGLALHRCRWDVAQAFLERRDDNDDNMFKPGPDVSDPPARETVEKLGIRGTSALELAFESSSDGAGRLGHGRENSFHAGTTNGGFGASSSPTAGAAGRGNKGGNRIGGPVPLALVRGLLERTAFADDALCAALHTALRMVHLEAVWALLEVYVDARTCGRGARGGVNAVEKWADAKRDVLRLLLDTECPVRMPVAPAAAASDAEAGDLAAGPAAAAAAAHAVNATFSSRQHAYVSMIRVVVDTCRARERDASDQGAPRASRHPWRTPPSDVLLVDAVRGENPTALKHYMDAGLVEPKSFRKALFPKGETAAEWFARSSGGHGEGPAGGEAGEGDKGGEAPARCGAKGVEGVDRPFTARGVRRGMMEALLVEQQKQNAAAGQMLYSKYARK